MEDRTNSISYPNDETYPKSKRKFKPYKAPPKTVFGVPVEKSKKLTPEELSEPH